MREIKFRAWIPRDNEMIEVGVLEIDEQKAHDYYNFYDGYAGTTAYLNVDRGQDSKAMLMQYTGLKDKNGKEIYESDVITTHTGKSMIIGWSERFASFVIMRDGWAFQHWFGEACDPSDCEVIGNIYQNPELL